MPRSALSVSVGIVSSICILLPLSPCGPPVGERALAKRGRVRGLYLRRQTPHPARTSSAPPSPTRGEGKSKKGGPAAAPCITSGLRSMRGVSDRFGAAEPDIDADEQEQPHHVDEVPVPGSEFEAEMLGRG